MASPSLAPKLPNCRRISLARIDEVVSARLGPTRGLGKSQPACFNRQVAMYLASQVGRWSTTVIGRFYGNRDHSTVVHAIQRIEAAREVEPDLDALLWALKSTLANLSDGIAESTNLPVVTSRPKPRESDIRLLAKELATQVRDVVREELRRYETDGILGTRQAPWSTTTKDQAALTHRICTGKGRCLMRVLPLPDE